MTTTVSTAMAPNGQMLENDDENENENITTQGRSQTDIAAEISGRKVKKILSKVGEYLGYLVAIIITSALFISLVGQKPSLLTIPNCYNNGDDHLSSQMSYIKELPDIITYYLFKQFEEFNKYFKLTDQSKDNPGLKPKSYILFLISTIIFPLYFAYCFFKVMIDVIFPSEKYINGFFQLYTSLGDVIRRIKDFAYFLFNEKPCECGGLYENTSNKWNSILNILIQFTWHPICTCFKIITVILYVILTLIIPIILFLPLYSIFFIILIIKELLMKLVDPLIKPGSLVNWFNILSNMANPIFIIFWLLLLFFLLDVEKILWDNPRNYRRNESILRSISVGLYLGYSILTLIFIYNGKKSFGEFFNKFIEK